MKSDLTNKSMEGCSTPRKCETCRGSGMTKKAGKFERCFECRGTGTVSGKCSVKPGTTTAREK